MKKIINLWAMIIVISIGVLLPLHIHAETFNIHIFAPIWTDKVRNPNVETDRQELDFIASHFDAIMVSHTKFYKSVNYLHTKNPNLKIYAYIDLRKSYSWYDTPDSTYEHHEAWIAQKQEDWYMHSVVRGSLTDEQFSQYRVESKNYSGSWFMDPANSGWCFTTKHC